MDVTVGKDFIVRVKKRKKELIISTLPTLPTYDLPKLSDYTIELMKIPLKLIKNTYILKNPPYYQSLHKRSVLIELKKTNNQQFTYIYVSQSTYFFPMESKVDLKNSNTEWISDNTYVYDMTFASSDADPTKYLRKEIVDMKKPFEHNIDDYQEFRADITELCWAEKTTSAKYKYAGIVKYVDSDKKKQIKSKKLPYDIIKYSKSTSIISEDPTTHKIIIINNKKKVIDNDNDNDYKVDVYNHVLIKPESLLLTTLRKLTGHKRNVDREFFKTFRTRCDETKDVHEKNVTTGEVILLRPDCAFKTVLSLLTKKYGHFITIRRTLNKLKLYSVFDIDDTIIFEDGRRVDADMSNFIKTLRNYGTIIYLTARTCIDNDANYTYTINQLQNNGLWLKGDVLKCVFDADGEGDLGLLSTSKWAARQKFKEAYGTEIVNVGDQLSDHMKHDDYYNFLKILQKI